MANDIGKYAGMAGVGLAVVGAFLANPLITALVALSALVVGYSSATARDNMKSGMMLLVAAVFGLVALTVSWSSVAQTLFFVPALMTGLGVFSVFVVAGYVLTHYLTKHK